MADKKEKPTSVVSKQKDERTQAPQPSGLTEARKAQIKKLIERHSGVLKGLSNR